MHRKKIRVSICDDHPAIRRTLSQFVEDQHHLELVAVHQTGYEAIEGTLREKPHILLLDVNMPTPDGFHVTKHLTESGCETKIIGFSLLNGPETVEKIFEHGASGYVTKTSPPEELLTAIDEVIQGRIYLCKELKNK